MNAYRRLYLCIIDQDNHFSVLGFSSVTNAIRLPSIVAQNFHSYKYLIGHRIEQFRKCRIKFGFFLSVDFHLATSNTARIHILAVYRLQ